MNDVVTPEEPKPPYTDKERWNLGLFSLFFGAAMFLANAGIPNATGSGGSWAGLVIALFQMLGGFVMLNRVPRQDKFSGKTLPDLIFAGSVICAIAHIWLLVADQ